MSGDHRPDSARLAPAETGPARRILLADDNVVNQKVAVAVLARLGLAARVVANGAEALEAALSGEVDLLLMDCRMPVMDGYEATRRLRAAELERGLPRIPVVAMTADAMDGDREQCLEAGMDDYLPKPIDPRSLATVLARWIDGVPVPTVPAAGVRPRGFSGDPRVTGEWREVPARAVARPNAGCESGGAVALADAPPVQLERLERIVGRERVTVRTYLTLFVSIAERLVADLRVVARDGNAAEVRRIAHQIKGSAASVGADSLASAAGAVEHRATEPQLGDLEPLIATLDDAWQCVRGFILAL